MVALRWRCHRAEMPQRRDSSVRSIEEAHVHDIITAMNKLDNADQLMILMVDAYSLSKLPRWHPEEINNASLADRMLRMENQMSMLQEAVEQNTAENLARIDAPRPPMTYAEQAAREANTRRPSRSIDRNEWPAPGTSSVTGETISNGGSEATIIYQRREETSVASHVPPATRTAIPREDRTIVNGHGRVMISSNTAAHEYVRESQSDDITGGNRFAPLAHAESTQSLESSSAGTACRPPENHLDERGRPTR